MILEPNQSKTDFQSCGIVKCLLTPENGPEIIHEILYPDGCCNIDENLVEEDGIFETAKGTFLCHNGEPVKIVTEDSVMSAYEDLMGGSPMSSSGWELILTYVFAKCYFKSKQNRDYHCSLTRIFPYYFFELILI